MPLTADRMLAVIEAAENIMQSAATVEKWALFRPPELDEAARVLSNPDCTVDDARAQIGKVISMYDGLLHRIRETLRPELTDVEVIAREGAHFRARTRLNASAKNSMRKLRARRQADAEGFEEYGLNYNPPDKTRPRPLTRAEFDALRAAERVVIPPEQQAELDAIWAKPAPQVSPTPAPTPPDDARAQYERERAERQREAEANASAPRNKLI